MNADTLVDDRKFQRRSAVPTASTQLLGLSDHRLQKRPRCANAEESRPCLWSPITRCGTSAPTSTKSASSGTQGAEILARTRAASLDQIPG